MTRLHLLLLAIAASIGVSARAAEPFHVQLLEPANEVPVTAGSNATIAWDATGIPGNVEEWEAFVSLDGGLSYPVRITPHLDVAVRSFTWHVPAFPGAEGSIMLRFGDEREERRFAFSRRFRIGGVLPLVPRTEPAAHAGARGEAAEPEGEGVVAWAEGPRDGTSIRQVVVDDSLLVAGDQVRERQERDSEALAGTVLQRSDKAGRQEIATAVVLRPLPQRAPSDVALNQSADILLITRRRNI